jgi:manganese transport protein
VGLSFENARPLTAEALLVNMAMIATAAVAFHDGAHDQIAAIETAYRAVAPLPGAGAAGLFMLALLASGFSAPSSG